MSAKPVVLVVEDEPLLRIMAVDMVEDAGFEALDAADATEAMRILEDRVDIRVVFTDIWMPCGMDGLRLAACIRDRWPPIEIILTSGHVIQQPSSMPRGSTYFAKPYLRNTVVAEMRRMAA